MSVDELAESISKHVDAMNENTRAAESQIAQLNTAQQIIDNYAGKTDLSTDAQGRLTWALQLLNDQLGLNISAQDVANGRYVDADGNVKNLKQSIDELVASKKKDAEVSALTANLTEAYQAQSEAANTLASKTKPYQDRLKELAKTYPELSKASSRRSPAPRRSAGSTTRRRSSSTPPRRASTSSTASSETPR